MPAPEKYSVASHTDSATPASTSDVSTCWPFAGAVTRFDGGQDADGGEEAGAQVGERHAGLDRRSAGVAGNRHDAGDALRDEIEAALLARRAGLAVARNRRVDQPRVERRQRRVVEAERGHHAGPVVLD